MKKLLLVAAVLAGTTSLVAATDCNKFAGLNGGLGLSVGHDAATYEGTIGSFTGRGGQSKVSFGGHVFLGYNTMISANQFIGAELGFGIGGANLSQTYTDEGDTVASERKFRVGVKSSWNSSFVLRLGHLLSDRTAVTFGIGIDARNFKVNAENIATAQTVELNKTHKKTKIGFSPRLGLEHNVSNTMFVRAEYAMFLSSDIKFSQDVTNAGSFNGMGSSFAHKAKITQHKLALSLGWRF